LYSSATGSIASATGRRGGADGDVDLVVGVGRGQQALAHVGLALVVLLDHHQLAAGDGHRAAGGVLQAHVEADDGLLGVGLQRPGLAGDDGDADITLALGLRQRRRQSAGGQRGGDEQGQLAALHGEVSWMRASAIGRGGSSTTTQPPCRGAPDQCKP
jgi:hypothetical protein